MLQPISKRNDIENRKDTLLDEIAQRLIQQTTEIESFVISWKVILKI